MVLAVCAFAHVDARLLLVRQALSEEIAATGELQGVIGFDREEFSDPLANALAPWDIVQIRAGVPGLFFNPGPSARGILVFKPAIRVPDGNPMASIGHCVERRIR